MISSGRDLQRTFGRLLSDYFAEVGCVGGRPRFGRGGRGRRLNQRAATELGNELAQRWRRGEVDAGDQLCLANISRRHHERARLTARREPCDREHSTDGPDRAVQRELSDRRDSLRALALELTGGNEKPQRDGKIERSSILADVGRSRSNDRKDG